MGRGMLAELAVGFGCVCFAGLEKGLHAGDDGVDKLADGQKMAGCQFHISPESEITDVAVIELHAVK